MIELLGFLAITILCGIGFLTIKGFNLLPKTSFFQILPFSFGLGVGLIAFQMFLYSLLRITWSLPFLLFPWMILFFIITVFNPDSFKIRDLPNVKLNGFDRVLIGCLVLLILFVGFEALLRPLSNWDGWASWLLKSKIFYIDGFINPSIFTYLNSEYPLVISLAGTFIYTVLGGVNDRVVLVLFFTFYAAAGGLLLTSLKDRIGKSKALILTFLLLSTQNLIRHGGRFEAGDADLALGYFFLADVILLMNYLKTKSWRTLMLFNLFLGITALVKNEGVSFSIVLFLYPVFVQWPRLFFLVPLLSWQIYKYVNHLPSLPSYITVNPDWQRIPVIVFETAKEFVNIKNWNLLWIAFFAGLFWAFLRKKHALFLIYFLIIFQLMIYGMIFLITSVDPVMHIRNVMDRLLLHLAPLAVFIIGITAFRKDKL